MTNNETARIMREVALLVSMKGLLSRSRVYEKTADALEAMEGPVAEIYRTEGVDGLKKIPGVGKSIVAQIATLLETGRLPYYEELHEKIPIDLLGLKAIEGLGPKKMKTLYRFLGIRSIEDLEVAAQAGKIRMIPSFGEKGEQKILRNCAMIKQKS